MSEVPNRVEYWEGRARDIVEYGFKRDDLERLVDLGIVKTRIPTEETVMGMAGRRKEGIFNYLEKQLGVTKEELMDLEDKEEAAKLASSEILVRIIAACHAFKSASQLPGDESRLKEQAVVALNLDLVPRFWKGMARKETVIIDGEEKSTYHWLREKGLCPVAGIKYLPEPETKLPSLLGLLEEKLTARTS